MVFFYCSLFVSQDQILSSHIMVCAPNADSLVIQSLRKQARYIPLRSLTSGLIQRLLGNSFCSAVHESQAAQHLDCPLEGLHH